MQNTEVSIGNIKYFFSLVLEDYFGDLEELMEMADIDEDCQWRSKIPHP